MRAVFKMTFVDGFKNHPYNFLYKFEQADDTAFIRERADRAAETYERARLEGYPADGEMCIRDRTKKEQRRNTWTNEDGSIRPISKWSGVSFTDQQKADYVAGKAVKLERCV